MLERLGLRNTGPAPAMQIDFAPRLNVITGDNGLGKSFLLDIAWWALSGCWPMDISPTLPSGGMALPADRSVPATIEIGRAGGELPPASCVTYEFASGEDAWFGDEHLRQPFTGVAFYAMADGSFAVWDSTRNRRQRPGKLSLEKAPPAFVFTQSELWNGLYPSDSRRRPLCNGLIADWAAWQREDGPEFAALTAALAALSPSADDVLQPGPLTRVDVADARDIPTIQTAYGRPVPITHASAGVRRIMGLTYLLVWAVSEREKTSSLVARPMAESIVVLIDEIESHLHPRWQQTVVPSLMAAMDKLLAGSEFDVKPLVQYIVTTHSPLVMSSLEPIFEPRDDAWHDIDLIGGQVSLSERDFEKHGDAESWLLSDAFDLSSTRSPAIASLVEEASSVFQRRLNGLADQGDIDLMTQRLVGAMNPKDAFLARWWALLDTLKESVRDPRRSGP